MSEPRRIDAPQPGFWLIRQAKGAPQVPACIRRFHTHYEPGNPLNLMERSPFLAAEIAGEYIGLDAVWQRKGEPITEAEYRFRCADANWAKQHAPEEPIANPRRAVDLRALPPIMPPGS